MLVTEPLSITGLGCLLQIEGGDVILALQGVQSILIIPENDEQPVRPFHTSLRDFLTTKTRSNNFFVNPLICHFSIVIDCLAVMIVHSGDLFQDEGLKYASQSWCHHLLCAIEEEDSGNLFNSQDGAFMMNKLTEFVSQSFDSWIDSMIVQETFHTANTLLSKLNGSPLLHTV